MFNVIFANDWIQTADLWNQMRPCYQLSHNHCPVMENVIWTVTVWPDKAKIRHFDMMLRNFGHFEWLSWLFGKIFNLFRWILSVFGKFSEL